MKIPDHTSKRFPGMALTRQMRGRLDEQIVELKSSDGSRLFLKYAPKAIARSIRHEHERLIWINGKIPAPEVVYFGTDDTNVYLLVTGLPGHPAHLDTNIPPAASIKIAADLLKRIHALAMTGCPFRGMLESELAENERLLQNGLIDCRTFQRDFAGQSAQDTITYLRQNQHFIDEEVFTHGDYCLPNIIIESTSINGVIDLGNCGVGDPYRDFSSIVRSIRRNFGEQYVDDFFKEYGLEPSHVSTEKLRYYDFVDAFYHYIVK